MTRITRNCFTAKHAQTTLLYFATALLFVISVQIVFCEVNYYLYNYIVTKGSALAAVPNDRSTEASFAISTIFDILTASRAASSKSDTGNIFKLEEAINTFASSTLVPYYAIIPNTFIGWQEGNVLCRVHTSVHYLDCRFMCSIELCYRVQRDANMS